MSDDIITTTREVVICNSCKGSGTHHCSELTDYHRREYDTWTEECSTCKGSGRLTKVVTLSPYVPEPPRQRQNDG